MKIIHNSKAITTELLKLSCECLCINFVLCIHHCWFNEIYVTVHHFYYCYWCLFATHSFVYYLFISHIHFCSVFLYFFFTICWILFHPRKCNYLQSTFSHCGLAQRNKQMKEKEKHKFAFTGPMLFFCTLNMLISAFYLIL